MEIRLQKYFSDCGILSRRAAEKEIADGHVTVNGIVAVMGQKVDPETDELYQKEKERSLREAEAARKAMDSLSEKQKELVLMLYGPDPITVSEYAAREGVSQPAISNRLKKIRKKLKKFL